jgi:hypothetical protein
LSFARNDGAEKEFFFLSFARNDGAEKEFFFLSFARNDGAENVPGFGIEFLLSRGRRLNELKTLVSVPSAHYRDSWRKVGSNDEWSGF